MKKYLSRVFQWITRGVPVVNVTASILQVQSPDLLVGRKVLVVGGSKGVGYEMAKKFVDCGAQVVIVGRDESVLESSAKSLGCMFVCQDICDIQQIPSLIHKSAEFIGGYIDTVVYNASLYLHEQDILKVTEDGFDRQMTTNVKAPYFLAQQFVQYAETNGIMKSQLLFVTSERGLYCDDVPYGLGKSAIHGLTIGLARRFQSHGMRVNAIAPATLWGEGSRSGENLYNKYNCGGRLVLPHEVAEVAAFVLSEAAGCMTGEVFPCDFGDHHRCDW